MGILNYRTEYSLPECSLCIYEETLALCPAAVYGQLASHSDGMAQLRLPCSELPKQFSNAASFEPSIKKLVKLLGSSCNLKDRAVDVARNNRLQSLLVLSGSA